MNAQKSAYFFSLLLITDKMLPWTYACSVFLNERKNVIMYIHVILGENDKAERCCWVCKLKERLNVVSYHTRHQFNIVNKN